MTQRSDAIVVGAGTAGAVIAARLVEAGLTVQLFEAGPDYGSLESGAWPDELLDFTSLPTTHDWGYTGTGAGGQALAYSRARVMGGCSSHNGCTQSIGWSGDWDRLAEIAGKRWSADAVARLAGTIAHEMRFRSYAEHEVQPFHRAFLAACESAGLTRADDLTDPSGLEGCGVAPVNEVDGTRFNTAFAYLDRLRSDPRLRVIPAAHVNRVLIDDDRRVFGVELLGASDSSRALADLVVLCGGAYGSPELLLRSGIGPANELRECGIDVRLDLPGVGRNLHDHPTAQLEFCGSALLQQELESFAGRLPEEQSLAKLASPHADGPYDLHVYPWVEPDPTLPHGWKVVVPIAQLRPRSRGSIRLRPGAPGGIGEVDPAFFSDAAGIDLSSVSFGVRWVLERVLTGPMAALLGPVIGEDPRSFDEEELRAWILRTHSHYWHPAGSCRIGHGDDPLAVVDGRGAVHGLRGLHVGDASVFPDIPRSTPAMPTVVAAEIIAAGLVETVTEAAPSG